MGNGGSLFYLVMFSTDSSYICIFIFECIFIVVLVLICIKLFDSIFSFKNILSGDIDGNKDLC